jgi:hypothetical protein
VEWLCFGWTNNFRLRLPFRGFAGIVVRAILASLDKKGLPAKVRVGLRTARVIWSKAVPAGAISSEDTAETAVALFNLVNMLVGVTVKKRRSVIQPYRLFLTSKPLRIKQKRRKRRKTTKEKKEVIPKPTLLCK